jgi:hypothetical protein
LQIFLQKRAKFESLYSSSPTVFDLSLRCINNYKECRGYKAIQFIKGGYGHLIDLLISKHEEKFYSKLNLNHKLEKIESVENGKRVLLNFQNGNRVLCDRVLCSMSLGFLKANIEHLIQPRNLISEKKLSVIRDHGFGTVNKVGNSSLLTNASQIGSIHFKLKGFVGL